MAQQVECNRMKTEITIDILRLKLPPAQPLTRNLGKCIDLN